jgi:predicted nucleic acid-binding protein
MKICLDASVAVAAYQSSEPSHVASRARVDRVLAGTDTIVVPAIFPIEVASALARRGVDAKTVFRYVKLFETAEVVTLGPKTATAIATLAVTTKLRAADATYAWVAKTKGVPLVTLDAEILTVDPVAVCRTEAP